LQPLRGSADLDGRKAVVEVELLGEDGPQGLIVIDQEDLLATVVYRHVCYYLRSPPLLLYLVRRGGKSGSLRQTGLPRAKDLICRPARSFPALPLRLPRSSAPWPSCAAAASSCCATMTAPAAW